MSNVSALKNKVRHYGEDVEPWKVAFDKATFCYHLEKQLVYGLYLYDHIARAERKLRDMMAQGTIEPQLAIETINFLWQEWLASENRAIAAIRYCEKSGYRVDEAERFRRCCKTARERDPSELEDIREIKEALDEPERFSHDEVLRELGLAK